MDIEIKYAAHKEPGYRWVVTAEVDGCTTTICYGTRKHAERYVLLCQLHNEVL